MRILYIASVRIPNEKASGLAIMRQCEAFASLGHEVALVRPFRTNHLMDDPFSYYGIEKTFNVHTLPSIDFKQRLGVLGFYIARLSQMVTGLFYLIQNRKRVDVIYVRRTTEVWGGNQQLQAGLLSKGCSRCSEKTAH